MKGRKTLKNISRILIFAICLFSIAEAKPKRPMRAQARSAAYHIQRATATVSDSDSDMIGIGASFSSMFLSDTKLTQTSLENPAMTGVTVLLRAKLDSSWGLEFSGGQLQGAKEDFIQKTIPITASVLFYLFPEARINPYFVGGTGLHLTTLSYKDSAVRRELTEVVFSGGGGLQLFLGKRIAIIADGKLLSVYKNVGEQALCGSMVCDLDAPPASEKFNTGYQLSAGLIYFF
jgi:hypothetical protein